MSAIKRMLSVFAAAALAASLFGCSSTEKDTENSVAEESTSAAAEESAASETEAPEEPATVQADIPLEYNGEDVNEGCADVINKYFTAIINQDYDSYKEAVDPYYFDVYNTWLDGTYGYGMLVSGFDRIALADIGDEGRREGIAGTDSISYLDTGRFDV